MSKEQVRLLKFALDYPGWHSMARSDERANAAMQSLAAHGLLEIADHGRKAQKQFRIRQPKA